MQGKRNCNNIMGSITSSLKVIYKGFFKSFIVLYADRICPEHHFVENRIENFPSVRSYSDFFFINTIFPRRVAALELSLIQVHNATFYE